MFSGGGEEQKEYHDMTKPSRWIWKGYEKRKMRRQQSGVTPLVCSVVLSEIIEGSLFDTRWLTDSVDVESQDPRMVEATRV